MLCASISIPHEYNIAESYGLTIELALERRAGGHFQARMGQQEAGDVGEAGVDVLPHSLQLLVLSILDLKKRQEGRKETS